jgi:hypothetical protein
MVSAHGSMGNALYWGVTKTCMFETGASYLRKPSIKKENAKTISSVLFLDSLCNNLFFMSFSKDSACSVTYHVDSAILVSLFLFHLFPAPNMFITLFQRTMYAYTSTVPSPFFQRNAHVHLALFHVPDSVTVSQQRTCYFACSREQ